MAVKALFLDRDGVINEDTGYVFRKEHFRFIDGVFDLCRSAVFKAYIVVIVTNQSGIERGYFTEEDFQSLTGWMLARFADAGVKIADVFHCPSLSGPDRKPNPGMFLAAKNKHDIDMSLSLSLGDKDRDIQAGRQAGVGTNVLYSAPGCDRRMLEHEVQDQRRTEVAPWKADRIITTLKEMEKFL